MNSLSQESSAKQSELSGESATSIFLLYKNVIAYQMRFPFLFFLLILGISIGIFYACLIPLVFKWLFNDVLIKKNIGQVLLIAAILGFSFILIVISSFLQTLITAKLATKLINYLRFKIFRKVQNLQMHDSEYESNIIRHFSNDIAFVEDVTVNIMWGAVSQVILSIVGSILLIYFNWHLSLLVAVVIPISLMLSHFYSLATTRQLKVKKQIETELLTNVQEGMIMQDVVRFLLLKVFKRRAFKEKLKKANTIGYKYSTSAGLTNKTAFLGIEFTKLIVLFVGAYLVLINHLTVGELVGFIILLGAVNFATSSLAGSYAALNRGAASFGNIQKLLMQKDSHQHLDAQTIPRFSQSICFENVSFDYGAETILSNINLTIKAGQSIVIVGPSGAGKSTLLKLLLQEQTPSAGRILFDGVDLQTIASHSLLSQIAVVMQQPNLFDASIRENIRMGKLDATEVEIIAAAKQAEIHDDIMQLPEQYTTQVGKRSSGISGGQCQRIAIARALISQPAILCLDEATSALDPITGSAISETLAKMAHMATIITITHRLNSILNADKIFVMDKGKIVESGTHQQLLNNNGLYQQLWDKQNGFILTPTADQTYVDPAWLKRIPLFASLNATELNNIAKEFVLERMEADKIVFHENDPGEKFYILANGIVDVIATNSQGGERIISRLIDGDFFGEVALLYDLPRNASVRTKGTCIFLTLHHQQFRKVFQQLPKGTQDILLAKAGQRLSPAQLAMPYHRGYT